MSFLRRVLYWQAALWGLFGAGIALAPRLVLVDLFRQRFFPEYAWVRLAGVEAVVLAMLMVLVAQRVEDHWWWAWGFALLEAAVGTLAVLNVVFSLPAHSSPVLWWLLAVVAVGFAAALLLGIARAGSEQAPG